ncbi:MAG: hypothetical protein KAX49_17235 [Halanaerobiales bacterium]|nr:hypothetical protein [Halanaerobiales bacterium]
MSHIKIGFCVNVLPPTQGRIAPIERKIANAFDYIGGILSTERLDGEQNVEYRNRLFDVTVHPSGPTYPGVINGLAREFGFLREKTLLIDLKVTSGGATIAEKPRVDILANRIVLYDSWTNPEQYTIDREVRFYDSEDEGFYLQGLVNGINNSTCFSANLYSGIRTNLHSFRLVRGTSAIVVLNDLVRADKTTFFKYGNIIQGTLWFEEKDIFVTEVFTTPVTDGEYYVDYTEGQVQSYLVPSGNGACGYNCYSFPLKVDSTPIQVFSLHDEDFTDELFYKENLDSGEQISGLPNGEGSEIYQQLFKETSVFWGR